MCSNCNNEHYHDEDCCCCECCEEEKELVRDRRELTDEEIESIIVEKYNTKDEKTKVFIRKALKVHGDWYDYSKVEYKNAKTKVTIICPIHKNFEQTPNGHLSGRGCKKCADVERGILCRKSLEQFIKDSKEIYKDRFSYDKVKYVNSKTKVVIHCNKHNIDFEQTPSDHLSGSCSCPKCLNEKDISYSNRRSSQQFIEEAIKIHNNKYNYDKVNYINQTTKVVIHCNKHNIDFEQTPSDHLRGRCGCPECHQKSIGETLTSKFLYENNISFKSNIRIENSTRVMIPDFILLTDKDIWIEYNGIQHYSITKYFHNNTDNFIDQLDRDLLKRIYCKENKIVLIEVPYIYNTYKKISDFLDKVIIQNIDPNTLVDYSKLYKLDDTGFKLEDLFP